MGEARSSRTSQPPPPEAHAPLRTRRGAALQGPSGGAPPGGEACGAFLVVSAVLRLQQRRYLAENARSDLGSTRSLWFTVQARRSS